MSGSRRVRPKPPGGQRACGWKQIRFGPGLPIVHTILKIGGVTDAAHISAEKTPALQGARLPQKNGHKKWTSRIGSETFQGKSSSDPLILSEIAGRAGRGLLPRHACVFCLETCPSCRRGGKQKTRFCIWNIHSLSKRTMHSAGCMPRGRARFLQSWSCTAGKTDKGSTGLESRRARKLATPYSATGSAAA